MKRLTALFAGLALVALLLFPQQGSAQVAGYTFSQSSGTYTEISGGTVLGTTSNDDENFNAINLGFTFVYNGVSYTQASVNTNGFLALGPTVVSSYTAISTGTSNNVVVALNRDLQGQAGSELMAKTEGTSPNQVFIVQWKGYRKYSNTGDTLNFQIRLNETSNTAVFVYGYTKNNATSTTLQLGLRGASSADFNNRTTTTDWSATTPGAVNTATMTLSSTVFPASGLTYTFTPPNYPPAISYTTLLNTTGTGNRSLNGVVITDGDGIAGGGLAPRIYWKVNAGSWQSAATTSGSSPYNFTIGTTGLVLGDTVRYFVVAQDGLGAVGANPSAGFSATDVNNITTYPTTPNSYRIVDVPLAGNYTVGLTMFNQLTGKNISFKKVVTTVMKEVDVVVPEAQQQVEKGKETPADATTSSKPRTVKQMMQVEEISWVPMENGREYRGDLFVKKNETPGLNYPANIDGIYATITAAVTDLNLRGVSAAVNFLLNDASYTTGETYPIVVNVANPSMPTATNKVTIKPNTGVTALVQGVSASAQIFKILTSYVNIDGSNAGGTDRSLTIQNTSPTAPQVVVFGSTGATPITGASLKNCIVINGATSSSAVIVSDGAAPGSAGYFTNITLQNNSIQEAYIGVYCNAVVVAGNGNGLVMTGNDLNSSGATAIGLTALYAQGVDGVTITNNNIGNFPSLYTANITGIWLATGTINATVSNNTIGPINITSAPPRGIVITSGMANANVTVSGNTVSGLVTSYSGAPYGIWVFTATSGVTIDKNRVSDIGNTNTGGYGARGIHVSTGIASTNITIKNNFVSNVHATGDASSSFWGIGIGIEGATTGVNVYANNVNLYGTLAGYTSATVHAAFAVITSTAALLDVRDNVFVNTFDNTNSSTDKSYAINSQAANTAFTSINYNDYYASGAPGVLGFLGADQATLAAWQTATGQDANSVSGDPHFVTNTDLHINTGYNIVSNNGLFLAAAPTDIDGDARSATTPDIGADEYVYVPPAVIDPTGVTATSISGTQIDVAFTPNASNNNVVTVFNLTGVFTVPSGPPPAPGGSLAGGTLIANTIVSPVHHTGLTPATTYYYKLFSYNGSQYSPGVTASAATQCGIVTSFPFNESFDGTTFPPICWANTQVSGSGLWSRVTSGVYPTCVPHSGAGMAEYNSFNFPNGTSAVLVTPQITFPNDNYQVVFWMYRDNGYPTLADRVQVYYNVTPDTIGGTLIGTVNRSMSLPPTVTTEGWYQYTFYVPTSSSGNAYIVFEGLSAYGNNIFVDDVTVDVKPACPPPTGLVATNITNVSAQIGWSSATTVDIDYGTVGHPAGTGTIVSGVTTNPYLLGGLTAYTGYDVFVRQSCGGGSYSTWAGPLTFTTQINPLTVPYSQSFDGATFPGGWTQSAADWTISTTSNAGGTPNEMHALWFSFVGQTRLILGPINTTGLTGLRLAFKHFYDDYGPGLTVKIQSSADATNWTDEAFSITSGNGNVGPVTVNTTIGSNLGALTYIAWVIDGDHFQFDNWYVDDVVVSIPLPNDVGTSSIDIPANITPGAMTPQATVKNFGTSTNSFNVQMNITGGYTSTKTVTNLAPGATQQVTFDSWNPTLGHYTAQVFTQLATDGDATNDTLYKNIGVFAGLYASGSVYPTTTYLGSGVAANGFLFSIGGNTTSALGTECYAYDVATDVWSPIASLPAGRRVLATAAVGNFVYAIGGSDMSSVYQATVYKYDIALDSWSTVAPLPVALGWGKAVGYNDKIYFAGGVDASSNVVSTVYVYDTISDTWLPATSLPGPKFGGAFSVTGNQLVYAAGANATVISSDVYVGTIDGTDPTVIVWATMAHQYPGISKAVHSEYDGRIADLLSLNSKRTSKGHRSGTAAAYPPGTMYRFDGAPWGPDGIIVANGSPTADWIPADPNPTYVYKPATDTWEQQPDVPVPVLGASLGTVNSGSTWKLVVASGYTGTIVTDVTQIYSVTFGSSQVNINTSIAQGWNMISNPVTNPVPGDSVRQLFPTSLNAYAFEYVPGSGYAQRFILQNEKGYWGKFPSVTTNTITGTALTRDTLHVVSGWNMVGSISNPVDTSTIVSIPLGLRTSSWFGYAAGYSPVTQLTPGKGYWVKANAIGQFVLANPPLTGPAKRQSSGTEMEKMLHSVTITDSKGSSQTLYFGADGDRAVQLPLYDMPPMPPAGAFDARFETAEGGSMVRTHATKVSEAVQFTIDVQSDAYPLTVTWKVNGGTASYEMIDGLGGKVFSPKAMEGEGSMQIGNSAMAKFAIRLIGDGTLPTEYALSQNYPNPFNPTTTISYALPFDSKVAITIYNVLGQRVRTLVNGDIAAGYHSEVWDGTGSGGQQLSSGVYFMTLSATGVNGKTFSDTRKLMMLK